MMTRREREDEYHARLEQGQTSDVQPRSIGSWFDHSGHSTDTLRDHCDQCHPDSLDHHRHLHTFSQDFQYMIGAQAG